VIVAVALPDRAREDIALTALRHCGARNIERAEGEIREGSWIDFDPVSRPQLVAVTRKGASLENYPGD
jgi:hypothetical protein